MMFFIIRIQRAILAMHNRLAQSTQMTRSDCVVLDPLPNQDYGSSQEASSLTRIIGAIIYTPAFDFGRGISS
jgi:hypothetical protein